MRRTNTMAFKLGFACFLFAFISHGLGCDATEIDLVFVLDASASMREQYFQLMKDLFKDFVRIADIKNGNVRVGVVIYSTEVHRQFNLNTHRTKADVVNAIDNIRQIHDLTYTNTAEALRTMREEMFTSANGDRPDVPNIAILVTNAYSDINSDRTIPEAEQARAEGIHIYAIGIGLEDMTELDGIASKPVEMNSFSIQDISEVDYLRGTVFSRPCELIPPLRTLSEVLKGCDDTKMDIVFVLDAYRSMWTQFFLRMKDFVKDFVHTADIDNGNVRVGAVIYRNEVRLQFHLNTHRIRADVVNAIDNIDAITGASNTADALRTMREEMFTPAHGDRPDVPNIAILVTQGVSDINSDRTIPEAEQARAEGIHIYAIGFGVTDTTELDGIASKPVQMNSFSIQDVSEFRVVRGKVFARLCNPSLYIVSGYTIYRTLEGTRAVLGCKSPRQLPPNAWYTWEEKADGYAVRRNLIFVNLTMAHHGKRVKCSVSYTSNGSSYGVSSDFLELQIYYSPRISITRKDNFGSLVPYQSSDIRVIPVTGGHNVTFRCEADSNPPPASITWSGNVNSSTGDLQILAADQAVHGGVYTCTVVTGTVPGDDRLPLTSSRQITVVFTGILRRAVFTEI